MTILSPQTNMHYIFDVCCSYPSISMYIVCLVQCCLWHVKNTNTSVTSLLGNCNMYVMVQKSYRIEPRIDTVKNGRCTNFFSKTIYFIGKFCNLINYFVRHRAGSSLGLARIQAHEPHVLRSSARSSQYFWKLALARGNNFMARTFGKARHITKTIKINFQKC